MVTWDKKIKRWCYPDNDDLYADVPGLARFKELDSDGDGMREF